MSAYFCEVAMKAGVIRFASKKVYAAWRRGTITTGELVANYRAAKKRQRRQEKARAQRASISSVTPYRK